MKLAGSTRRIELIPESEEEKAVCQDILDNRHLVYWGDRGEEQGGALIINTTQIRPSAGEEGRPQAGDWSYDLADDF